MKSYLIKLLNIFTKLSFKISLFSTIGYITATGVPTYLDPLLKTHIIYHERIYPLGYWILLPSILVFIITYYGLEKNPKHNNHFSWLPLFIFGGIALFNFLPELPNGNVVMWTMLYCIVSFITNAIHFRKENATINTTEYIKSSISLWSIIMIALFSGYIAIIIPWTNNFTSTVNILLTNDSEKYKSISIFYFQLGVFSIYVFIGPIYEAYNNITQLIKSLLIIKNEKQ